jgi:hypothetical protein
MENKNSKDLDRSRSDSEEVDLDELTSHKIDKNSSLSKNKKKLVVILEHS